MYIFLLALRTLRIYSLQLLNIPCSIVSYSRHAIHSIPSTYLSHNQKFVPFNHLQFPHSALILQDPPSSQTGTEVAWPQYSPLPRTSQPISHIYGSSLGPGGAWVCGSCFKPFIWLWESGLGDEDSARLSQSPTLPAVPTLSLLVRFPSPSSVKQDCFLLLMPPSPSVFLEIIFTSPGIFTALTKMRDAYF